MTNRVSSFPGAGAPAPLRRYGGKIGSTPELAISAIGDTYFIEGSGTVLSLPNWPRGPAILFHVVANPTLVNSSKLLMPGGQNYAFSGGDSFWALPIGDMVWRVIAICRADGSPAVAHTPATGGRLTPVSGSPTFTADQTAMTSIFYAPFASQYISLYDGTTFRPYRFTSSNTDTVGLTLALGSNWAASTLHDAFITLVGGVPVIATIPWSSSAAGTSAQATALSLFQGVMTNATSATARISNASTITMAANQGTYIGTFLTSGTAGQIDFKFGSAAAGGGAAIQSVWNMYNPVQGVFVVTDSVSSAGVSVANTMQPFDIGGTGAGLNNRVTFVQGLATNMINAEFGTCTNPAAGHASYIAIGLNSTSAPWSRSRIAVVVGVQVNLVASGKGYAPAGLNYVQALVEADTTATPFFGNASRTFEGLTLEAWY